MAKGLLDRRRMMQAAGGGGLPSEYQLVEYLESTGVQYIITDIMGSIPPKYYHSKFMLQPSSVNSEFLDGCRTNAGWLGIIQNQSHSTDLGATWGSGYGGFEFGQNMRNIYIEIEGIFEDGQLPVYNITPPYNYNFEPSANPSSRNICENINFNVPFCLFARYYLTSATPQMYTGKGRLCFYEIGNAPNDLLYNFLPCYRKSDNVAGMYDIINQRFETNAGTGSFAVGPDVN